MRRDAIDVKKRRGRHRSRFFQAVSMLIILFAKPTSSLGWLYNSVPPIQGVVEDATTKLPIEKAVLVVRWSKTIHGFFHPQPVLMKKIYIATDSEGRYTIPSYWSTHLVSRFTSVDLTVRNPIYETVDLVLPQSIIDIISHPELAKTEKIPGYLSVSPAGSPVVKISLRPLKVKFREKPSLTEFRGDLEYELLFEGPKYFSAAKQLGLQVDSDEIFKEWQEIADRFSDAEYIQRAIESGKKRIAEGFKGE